MPRAPRPRIKKEIDENAQRKINFYFSVVQQPAFDPSNCVFGHQTREDCFCEHYCKQHHITRETYNKKMKSMQKMFAKDLKRMSDKQVEFYLRKTKVIA